MARRAKGLHHNLSFADPYGGGKNVVYHREHRSPRNRGQTKKNPLQPYKRASRRKWNQLQKSHQFIASVHTKTKKKR